MPSAPCHARPCSARPYSAKLRSHAVQACALLLLFSLTALLSGCGSFFSCEGKSDCPTTTSTSTSTSTSSTTDYAYIGNSSVSNTYVDGYNVGSGTLTAVTDGPFSFGYPPSALVINPANTLLYAASDSELEDGVGNIYAYSIGTGGALSILDSGSPQVQENVTYLAVDPTGQWLFCLDTDGETLEEYSIDSSTGALTYANTYGVSGALNSTITPASVAIAPSDDYVVVAMGTGGAETFSFDSTTGLLGGTSGNEESLITPATDAIGIYAVAVDKNNYLYCAGTAGLQVFSATVEGVPTLVNTYTTGNGPKSITINPASTFIYIGNQTDSTITAYAIGANAVLTTVTGSPFNAPSTVSSIGVDSTGAYLLAAGYNSSTGIQLFDIGSTGVLTSAATAGTGVSVLIPTPIAMTP